MTLLLRPAVALMQRLRLLPKFLVVSLVFLAPLLLVTGLLMAELQKSIAGAAQEQRGVAYIAQLHALSRLVQRERGLDYLRLSGKPQPADPALRQAIEDSLRRLDAFQQDAAGLRALPALAALRARWQALGQAGLKARERFAQHTALLVSINQLSRQVADRSGLSQDPEAASDYLVIAFVGTLPDLAEGLSEIAGRGAAFIDTGLFEAHEDQLLNAGAMIARHQLEQVPGHYDSLFRQRPELKPALQAGLKAVPAGLAFLERTANEVTNSYNQTSGKDYLAAGEDAVDSLYRLATASAEALQQLLAQRAARDILHRNLVLAAILATLALAAWLLAAFYTSFSREIGRLNQAVRRAAGGDLTGRPRSRARDEIGDLVNAFGGMAHGLVDLVTDIRSGAATIASATHEMADGNANLSQHTATQSRALTETMRSLHELGLTVRRNASHADQGRELAGAASVVAERGGRAVGEVVATMTAIRAGSHKIADIIGVINGIAFQTNILALNAAVEAARAGEQGRGFAVVAGEVRNLAQRSAAAALEIRQLIEAAVSTADSGNARVAEAGATIGQLVQSVRQVEAIIGQIAAAGHTQETELDRLEQALGSIGAMTRQNGALVEAASAGSARLHEETGNLARAVSMFTLETGCKTLVLEHSSQ